MKFHCAPEVRLRHFGLSLLVAASSGLLLAENDWIPEVDGLPLDPAIHARTLPSGLRYLHAQHADPNQHVSLRLIVQAGSNDEADDELGYAHFVEHMAFNGTRNFPGETLGAKLAEAGIRFGPEVNAFTMPALTVYQLDLSHYDPETFELALQVMRDWSDGIQFDRKQVRRERKVILAEMQARGIIAGAFTKERMKFVYPDHPLGQRFVGGTLQSIDRAEDDGLKGYYDRWYRPDNMVLVVVGDMPTATVTAGIDRHFASFTNNTPLPPRAFRPVAANPTKPRLHWTQIGPIKSFNFQIVHTRPMPTTASIEQSRHSLATQVVLAAMQARFNRLIYTAGSEVKQLSVQTAAPSPDVLELTFHAEGKPENWENLLLTLNREHRRLIKHGILQIELDEARDVMLKRLEFAGRFAKSESASTYAARMLEAVMLNSGAPSADTQIAFAKEVLPTLTIDDCRAAVADFLETGFARYFIYGDLASAGASQDLVATLQTGMREDVTEPLISPQVPFLYHDFGPVGTVTHHDHDKETDVHQVTFANGVRFNFKRTDFDQQTMSVVLRLAPGGQLATPPGQPGMPHVAAAALIEGALGDLNFESLGRALNGRTVRVDFNVEEDSLSFNGTADREQVDLLMQLITAYLTDPALEAGAVSRALTRVNDRAESSLEVPETAMGLNLMSLLTGEDPRFAAPPTDGTIAFSAAELRAWLLPQLEQLPIEFSMVGDIVPDEAIAAVARTLGALPSRQSPKPRRALSWNTESRVEKIECKSPDRRGAVAVIYPVRLPADNVRARRELELLTHAFEAENLKRLREAIGITYSPDTRYWYSESDPQQAFIQASMITDSRMMKKASGEVRRLANRLRKSGIDDELMMQARNPTLDSVNDQLRGNTYWLYGVLDRLAANPQQLDYARSRRTDLESITKERLTELANEVLNSKNAIQVLVGRH
ncbi:M16 family metallopeptidase [Synoicihabitans lomoniglobus]|uniref:Insulinase family protein n=1 Tax=Synoicihabitans lomoniglobus TaxID=2909285 RepID=A0AAE9ZQU7_9BACT|nr:insulinase family protein [Opitutaceae bacterium LMO-M01]WED63450.1 insulinase family protein [Opitutaceae bacterium LMO-M01]